MSNKKASWLKHLDFTIWDVFCLLLAYALACLIRYGNIGFLEDVHHQWRGFVIGAASLTSSFLFERYQEILRRGYYKELRAVLQHVIFTAAVLLADMFLVKRLDSFSRSIYIMTFVLGGALVYIERITWKKVIQRNIANNDNKARVLVIVKNEFKQELIQGLSSKKYVDYQLKGCVIYDHEGDILAVQGVPVVCEMKDVMEYVKDNVLDEILIQPEEITEEFRRIIQELVDMGITVHIELSKLVGDFPDMRTGRFGDYKVITISIHKVKMRQLVIKRTLDIIGGVVGLLITGIAFVIVAPIIKIQSPGPIFFSQERVGKNGRVFKIYKFRSMYADAEERKKELMAKNKMQGHMFKMDNDPRITPIGNFIRKYSVDELPQFWNVLRGSMSLVGTRPPTVDEVKEYDKHHRVRLSIKPGITGLWQVSGRSDIIDFEEVVKLDERYIREWNLGLDFKILLQTVLVVLGRKGSI